MPPPPKKLKSQSTKGSKISCDLKDFARVVPWENLPPLSTRPNGQHNESPTKASRTVQSCPSVEKGSQRQTLQRKESFTEDSCVSRANFGFTNVNTKFKDIIGHGGVKLRIDEILLPLALPQSMTESVLRGKDRMYCCFHLARSKNL